MFKHILVPIDGSATSLRAIDKATSLAKAFGSKVTALYVIDPYPFTGVGADFALGQDQYLDAAKSEANAAMEAARVQAQNVGATIDSLVTEAHTAWRGIIDTATQLGVDLLVMGSHGRRGLEKLVLGSVTQSVLAHTRITTLVVRDAAD
ncbi:universal stress protein [Ottowia sp.]|uniref:universal stress protein n=1 Tax=Ottowia sp. TaxID=1898956 RepID=UPI003A8B5693